MASLTTVDKVQYYFDPSNIAAISNHDPSSGAAMTCVYGISAGYLKIEETAQAFMTRLNIGPKFAVLTRTDGAAIWVNRSSVTSIRTRVATDGAGANALLLLSSLPLQSVKETAAAAAAALGLDKK